MLLLYFLQKLHEENKEINFNSEIYVKIGKTLIPINKICLNENNNIILEHT